VQTAAEREDIAPEVIATSRDIESLAAAGGEGPETVDLDVLHGWRRRLVGERLLAIARGEVAIRYDPATRSVVTEPVGASRV
jgi:ribonuclease D